MAYGYASLSGGTAKRILRRDNHRCYLCAGPAAQVDHVIPVSQGGSHDDANLAAICIPCHQVKSEGERRAGLAKVSRRRPTEPHPGLISPGA